MNRTLNTPDEQGSPAPANRPARPRRFRDREHAPFRFLARLPRQLEASRFPALALGLALALWIPVLGQESGERGQRGAPGGQEAEPRTANEKELAALAFVEEHHPELARLLERLKRMSRAEYNRAIADLDKVRSGLENTRRRDPERYAVDLDAWKAKSKIDVLMAKLAAEDQPDPKLEQQLRDAFAAQVSVQIRQQNLERNRLLERVKVLDASLNRLEREGETIARNRYEAAARKAQRLRGEGRAKSRRPPASTIPDQPGAKPPGHSKTPEASADRRLPG